MAFFVKETKGTSKHHRDPKRLDLELLALGKRSRLSFAEINELRVSDLLAYVGAYTGAQDDGPRKATQNDIDKFYA